MSRTYRSIALTGPVLDSQVQCGSRAVHNRIDGRSAPPDTSAPPDALIGSLGQRGGEEGGRQRERDPMGPAEREFIGEQDGFYLATVSESGWPYVQLRGGAPGFVTSPDLPGLRPPAPSEDLRSRRRHRRPQGRTLLRAAGGTGRGTGAGWSARSASTSAPSTGTAPSTSLRATPPRNWRRSRRCCNAVSATSKRRTRCFVRGSLLRPLLQRLPRAHQPAPLS